MQTKQQKREKALAYWERELQNNRLIHREAYIKNQIAILRRKLTMRAGDNWRAWYETDGESQPTANCA